MSTSRHSIRRNQQGFAGSDIIGQGVTSVLDVTPVQRGCYVHGNAAANATGGAFQGWQRRRRRRGFPGFMQRLQEPEQLGSHASTCDANSTPSDPGGQRPTRRSRRPPPSAADRLRRLPTDGYYAARRDRLPMPLRYKGSSDFNRPATFRKTSCMFARGFSREASGPPSPGEPPASAEDHLAIRKMKALLSKQYRTTRVDPLHSYLATNRILQLIYDIACMLYL